MIDPQLAAMTEITIERQDSTTATMTLRDLLDDRRAEPWLLQIVGILCRAAVAPPTRDSTCRVWRSACRRRAHCRARRPERLLN